jgi:hypothetical protein
VGRSSLWGAGLTHATRDDNATFEEKGVASAAERSVHATSARNKDSPKLLEGKGKDVRPGGRVMLILLIDREGVLEWNLEVGGR